MKITLEDMFYWADSGRGTLITKDNDGGKLYTLPCAAAPAPEGIEYDEDGFAIDEDEDFDDFEPTEVTFNLGGKYSILDEPDLIFDLDDTFEFDREKSAVIATKPNGDKYMIQMVGIISKEMEVQS